MQLLILQASIDPTVWLIISILIATILLWLMLYVASGWIISKTWASDKKISLLISSLILVVVLPILSGLIGMVLNFIGGGIASLRTLIYPSGQNYVGQLVSIIEFLLFMVILRFICGIEWKDTVWISLIGLFLLYCLYSFFPELYTIWAW